MNLAQSRADLDDDEPRRVSRWMFALLGAILSFGASTLSIVWLLVDLDLFPGFLLVAAVCALSFVSVVTLVARGIPGGSTGLDASLWRLAVIRDHEHVTDPVVISALDHLSSELGATRVVEIAFRGRGDGDVLVTDELGGPAIILALVEVATEEATRLRDAQVGPSELLGLLDSARNGGHLIVQLLFLGFVPQYSSVLDTGVLAGVEHVRIDVNDLRKGTTDLANRITRYTGWELIESDSSGSESGAIELIESDSSGSESGASEPRDYDVSLTESHESQINIRGVGAAEPRLHTRRGALGFDVDLDGLLPTGGLDGTGPRWRMHYGLTVDSPWSVIGRAVEESVFVSALGYSPELIREEYDPYDPISIWIVLTNAHERAVVGSARVLRANGNNNLKLASDLRRRWGIELSRALELEGIASGESVMEVATLSILAPWRRADSHWPVRALCAGIGRLFVDTGHDWSVQLQDTSGPRLLRRNLGLPFSVLANLDPVDFLGPVVPTITHVASHFELFSDGTDPDFISLYSKVDESVRGGTFLPTIDLRHEESLETARGMLSRVR